MASGTNVWLNKDGGRGGVNAYNEAGKNFPEKLADIVSLVGYCSSQEFNVGTAPKKSIPSYKAKNGL